MALYEQRFSTKMEILWYFFVSINQFSSFKTLGDTIEFHHIPFVDLKYFSITFAKITKPQLDFIE